ncbi:MAG: polysaccharide lyase family 8 super-sandwich domain-containing protein [Bacteroidota bacterium]
MTPLMLVLSSFLSFLSPEKTDDFIIIRTRVVDELLKTTIEKGRVEDILSQMNPDGSFQGIDYADLSRTAGFPHGRHTYNLVYLAEAYKKKSSPYYKSKKIKERITTSLRHWVKNDFFGDNWHNNQITTPTNLVNLMLLVGDEMPKDLVEGAQPIIGRAHMNASGARPSGDRIVIAGILAKNLLFIGDREKFDEIIELIEGEVKFSTGQRGMQHDYSFHHRVDRVNNTDSYGYGKYANNFGEWAYYVAGTKYAFSTEKINHLIDYYLDGIYKQQVYGIYSDISVKNRSITHKATFKPQGTEEIERLLISTDYRKDELEEIMRLRKGEAKPSASFAKFFWQTEHFVVQRPNFYTTVRMFSTRNKNMEVPYNGPGKPTHHRADGTNYLQLRGDEYHNIWPVYDWQKISGTTIMQKPQLPPPTEIQKPGYKDFVGAVTDGYNGAVAFDFLSPHDLVAAKKSWFFFDDHYVCLGTDITSDPNLPVATTINQVFLRSPVVVMNGGSEKELPKGERMLEDTKWVHQDRIGYLFPQETSINLSNQTEQGRWSDITDQKNISDELISEEVFTLWFDHGKSPNNASYEYIVLPDVSVEELKEFDQDNPIKIVSNTGALQAVMNEQLGIYQAAFYQADIVNFSEDLTVELASQGMVMIKMEGDRISEMTVSDPSRKLTVLMVTVSGHYNVEGNESLSVYPNPEINRTHFMIYLPQGVYHGKSVTIKL